MSPFRCPRESELTGLLDRGQWPLASSAELRAHVAGCRNCSDLVLLKRTFQAARAATTAMPVLPSAGALWWRAQLRRRNEAIERIGRPILGAQIFALAMFLLLAAAALAWQVHNGLHPVTWIESLHFDALLPATLPSFEGGLWFLVPLLSILAIVSGVVVYFASEKR